MKESNGFTDEETEAQRGHGTCPKSVAELRPEPRLSDTQPAPSLTELVYCFPGAWQLGPEGLPGPPGYELEGARGMHDALIKDSFASFLNWLK